MGRFCTNCGAPLEENANFCTECGTKIDKNPTPPLPSQPSHLPENNSSHYVTPDMGSPVQSPPQKRGGGFFRAVKIVFMIALIIIMSALVLATIEKVEKIKEAETEATADDNTADGGADSIQDDDNTADGEADSIQDDNNTADGEADSIQADDNTADGEIDPAQVEDAELPSLLSTDERAVEMDFDWFVDYVENLGNGKSDVITNTRLAYKTESGAALNGGWRAYMFTSGDDFGSDVERFFNAEIDTQGSDFNIRMNWGGVYDPAEHNSYEESGSDLFEGTFDEKHGEATAESSYATVEFEAFYISRDHRSEYAVGTFNWNSGETDRIALMRCLY